MVHNGNIVVNNGNMGVSIRATPKWIVYNGKSIYKWMMKWGTPIFRKPPYGVLLSNILGMTIHVYILVG